MNRPDLIPFLVVMAAVGVLTAAIVTFIHHHRRNR